MKKEEIIFGIRAIIEAIKSGKEIDKVFVRKGLRNPLFMELNALLNEYQIPVQYVPIEKLNRITTKNHQGTIAFISAVIYHNIENIIPGLYESGEIPLILVLDKVTDVRNLGAISRTVECSGSQAIVIPAHGSAQINSDAIKTSAGALNIVPVCRSNNLKETLEFLKNSGLQIIAATEKADLNYTQIDYRKPTAIIMGSEDRGISEEYLKRSDHQVTIPLQGKIESLNVSVATAIMLSEAVRQRQL